MNAMARRLPELTLSVQHACKDHALPSRAQVRRWLRASCPQPAEVAVRFVDLDEARTLNRDYRDKDYATNVLSFSYQATPTVSGDLVICPPLVAQEALAQGKSAEAHFAHLIVHGMLHLQGYDHDHEAAAESMEAKEREILARLGYADPY